MAAFMILPRVARQQIEDANFSYFCMKAALSRNFHPDFIGTTAGHLDATPVLVADEASFCAH